MVHMTGRIQAALHWEQDGQLADEVVLCTAAVEDLHSIGQVDHSVEEVVLTVDPN